MFSISQGSEYGWSKFHRVFSMPLVLNMPRLEIWKVCEFARVIQGSEYAGIRLNTP